MCIVLVDADNELHEGGVTAPKHVGAIFIINFNIIIRTITCAFIG